MTASIPGVPDGAMEEIFFVNIVHGDGTVTHLAADVEHVDVGGGATAARPKLADVRSKVASGRIPDGIIRVEGPMLKNTFEFRVADANAFADTDELVIGVELRPVGGPRPA